VRERMSPPIAYLPYADFAEGFGTTGLAQAAVVSATRHDADNVRALARAVEQKLPQTGMPLGALIPTADFRKAVEDHLLIIARLLLAMSLLVVAVGGLGLGSAMSIRTLDRRRELGVIRALGASRRRVVSIVMVEAVAIGTVSWLLAAGWTVPMSAWTSRRFGMLFFQAPLEFTFSWPGLGAWLVMVLVVAAAASALPARRAANTPVARALACE
jgi:putative ABC transport system permease protein